MNKDKPALPMPAIVGTIRRQGHVCPVPGSGQHRILPKFSLILLSACLVAGCAQTPPIPKPTTSVIPISEMEAAQGGPQFYNLSPRQRRMCEKRAAEGDILAAKTLVEYHEMVTRDEKQYHYWMTIVSRLERAQHRKQ